MNNNRVVLVDFLRGFALMGIVLIHCVEHFDFFAKPETYFLFSSQTDGIVMNTVFLLISGKAYSIFALMFGFSFFIQMNRQENKGVDFRGRFLWRLTLLLTMGFIHSLLYKGDILHIYALIGFVLVALYKVNTKILLTLAILLALQIPLCINLIHSLVNPNYEYIKSIGAGLWQEADQTYANGSFWDVVQFNFWKGRLDVWGWTIYNGRYLQLLALFIVGLVIGRLKYFENIAAYRQKALKLLGLAILVIIGLILIRNMLMAGHFNDTQKELFGTIFNSYLGVAYTAAIILILIQVYIAFSNWAIIQNLACYGRMSLTNYVTQAVLGVIFFYGYGLAMYKYMGSTWSILYGAAFLTLQIAFSKYWLKHYKYGPLEWFWRACTFLDFKIKNRLG
jgi:uncharacterized protein